jgi:DNA-binding response OmpR family regulator
MLCIELMETIKLLLAHADRRVNNLIEVAVLDVCYDRAVVQSTRTTKLDELVHQGSLWDFHLIVVGVDNLLLNRGQQGSASPEEISKAIQTIRSQNSTPIIAFTGKAESRKVLLEAGAHSVLEFPFKPEQLKSAIRPLLDLGELVDSGDGGGWPAIGSLLRAFR